MATPRVLEQRTNWESEGVERPQGQRYWQPGEEPPAEHFNWWFWSTFKDIEDLAKWLDEHGVARFLRPDEFTLAGDPAAYMGLVGTTPLPSLVFPAGVVSSAMTMVRGLVPTDQEHYADVYWTCDVATENTTVLEVRYGELVEGSPVNVSLTTSQHIVGTGGAAYTLVKTTFVLQGITQGRPVVLWVVRNGLHPSDTIQSNVHVLFVEVR